MSAVHAMRVGLRARVLALIAFALLFVVAAFLLGLRQEQASHADMHSISAEAMRQLAFDGVRHRGEALANMLAEALANPVYYSDLAQIGEIIASAKALPDVVYVVVYDREARVLHDGSPGIQTYGSVMDDAFAYEIRSSNTATFQYDEKMADVAVPIRAGSERLGGVRVGLSLQTQKRLEAEALADLDQHTAKAARRNLQLFSIILGVLLLTAFTVALLLSRWVVAPIQRIAEAARRVALGDFAVALPGQRSDEIGDLERRFVSMAKGLERHHNEVRRIAYSDALTGLANRLAFREEVDSAILAARSTGRRLGLLFIDLDDFKRINDSFGHEVGDQVLIDVADRLLTTCRDADAMDCTVGRLGGDEFVILVGADDVRMACEHLAHQVIESVSQPYHLAGHEAFLGASVGITLYPEDADDTRGLLKAGDIAMYESKLSGKNTLRFYNPALDRAVAERAQIEQALRGAWERGELSVCFQPIYDLANRRLVGAEALLRWQSPLLGEVKPGVFVGIAERAGMIDDIGHRVLLAACDAAAHWDFSDRQPFVSVNVSALQWRKGDLGASVERALKDSGLAPERLHLELTETAVMGDTAAVAALATRLRGLGVKIWLDDFGTGFSGLSHLRRLPVDGVKIDRSFVEHVARDDDDLALTTAIIGMAHALGFTVVAEGVESEEQFELLRARGCDQGQGYWLGHPVPDARFTADHLANPQA